MPGSAKRSVRAKPYLQLVRLPNLFTAAADSLAGWLLATGSLANPREWLPLVAASVAVYAGGVALNDVFDYRTDLDERPGRPLPSGAVPFGLAAGLSVGLLMLGLALAWLAGTRRGLGVAVVLVLAVLAYDARAKSTLLGPWVMGSCRSLNLLLGLSASATLGGASGWVAAGAYGVFVAGITWVSRSEVRPEARFQPGIAAGVFLQNLALLGLLAAAVRPEGFAPPIPAAYPWTALGPAVLLVVAALVNRRTLVALRSPTAPVVQRAVKAGIFALVWLHVGVLLATRGPAAAAAVAWLWLPALLTGRWVYST